MSGQISSVVKCVHFHLRNLSRIRRFIDQDTCKLAVQALVFSRIDYGNALLLEATDFDLTRLQRLQNRTARLIFLVGRDTSSAPLLRRLHWLPIRKRIEFKILVIVYKCVNSQAPDYLSNLISFRKPTYATRSSHDSTLLSIPRTRTRTADNAFQVSGPRLWNSLPTNMRQAKSLDIFKGQLKTHLFN